MSRRVRDLRDSAVIVERPSSLMVGMMLGAALAAMALILVLVFLTWSQTRSLDGRFAALDVRLTQLSTKVEQAGTRAAAPQRGPDPNRVYTIRTEGAPFKGPRDAPITIAAFSEFQ